MSYDPKVALDFFKAAGKPTALAKGKTVFAEKEKEGLFQHSKIYLVLQGEVSLLAGRKVIGTLKPGEVFGEMAAITHAPRSATAVAKKDCTLIALDDKELERGLAQNPAFALMLMSIMIGRLRDTIARLNAAGALVEGTEVEESAAFDPQRVQQLIGGLADDPPMFYQQGKSIMSEGQRAMRMYVVVSGRVAVSVGGRVVERLGPGGVFGEAALIEQSTRMASAVAEADSELLTVTRPMFLQLVKVSPEFGLQMLASLAARLRFLTERL
jgi:CRP-like cAMP-binding protein